MRILLLVGASLFCQAPQAVAGDPPLGAGSALLTARLIGTLPYDQHTSIDVIGGSIDLPAQLLPDLELTYFLTDHLAIGGEAGIVPTSLSATGTLIGTLPIGKVWTASLLPTAEWHFRPGRMINPYLGVGFDASWYFGEQPAGGYVTSFKVSPDVEPVVQGGFDVRLAGNWYGNFDVKQVFVPSHTISGEGAAATVGLDVLIIGVGVGYRF